MNNSPKDPTLLAMIEAVYNVALKLPEDHQQPLLSLVKVLQAYSGGSGMADSASPATVTEQQRERLGYDASTSYREKFAYFLREERRFLHLREVADLIIESELLDRNDKDTKKLPERLSHALASLKKDGSIVKVQVGTANRNTYWGLPKWLGPDNNAKQEHAPNQKYLMGAEERVPLFDDL